MRLSLRTYNTMIAIRLLGRIKVNEWNEESLTKLMTSGLAYYLEPSDDKSDYSLFELTEDGNAELDDWIISWVKAVPIPVAVALIVELLIHK